MCWVLIVVGAIVWLVGAAIYLNRRKARDQHRRLIGAADDDDPIVAGSMRKGFVMTLIGAAMVAWGLFLTFVREAGYSCLSGRDWAARARVNAIRRAASVSETSTFIGPLSGPVCAMRSL